MTDHYRIIRKEINLTPEELEQIQELMRQEHAEQFSPFVRQKLMYLVERKQAVTDWFTFWQSQKIEQISRDILQVTIMAEQTQQVTAEHLRIILTCVQELMAEVEKFIPLSQIFVTSTWEVRHGKSLPHQSQKSLSDRPGVGNFERPYWTEWL